MNVIGRPYNENAIVRNGKRYNLFFYKDDKQKLEALAKRMNLRSSEVIRRLVRKEFDETIGE